MGADETWVETSTVLSVFPTLIWQAQVRPAVHLPLNEEILGVVAELRESLPEVEPGTAWQSNHSLHKRKELGRLVRCVEDTVTTVLRFLKIGCEAFEITGCWANVNAPGAAHKSHHHPNNYLSGVYYVRAPSGADTINFHDPRIQTGILRPPVVELTAQNTDQVVVRVKEGTLLVFPAYLEHSVDSNNSEKIRVSVSFNVMFSSFTESLSTPLWGEE